MIITLSGNVAMKDAAYAVIDVGGVGYQVHMNAEALAALPLGSKANLWTHEHIREDARELYGFSSQAEHRLFRRLISVSGIGPKMAMNIFSLGPVRRIEQLIEKGDIDALTTVSGIGKKTAQKMILELKGKLVEAEAGEGNEVLAALVGLGYSRERARDALSRVPAGVDDRVEDRLRLALRELGSAR